MADPTCECIESLPQIDKLKAIYSVTKQLAANDPSLPDCPQTVNDLLDSIYCATLIWAQQ